MALRQFAVCRLSEARCLGERCPLGEGIEGPGAVCPDGWLRWDDPFLPLVVPPGKGGVNISMRRLHFPLPEEVRFSPASYHS